MNDDPLARGMADATRRSARLVEWLLVGVLAFTGACLVGCAVFGGEWWYLTSAVPTLAVAGWVLGRMD